MAEELGNDDEVIMTELVLPTHTNALGTVFGGVIMSWIDIAGAIAAQRHARKTVVTASIDDLSFVAAVKLGWVVQLRARVNFTSNTSMEVGVRVDAENPQTGQRYHTASAYLTFVAINEQGKPVPIPMLKPADSEGKRRFDEAIKRRELRLKRRQKKEKGFSIPELMVAMAIGGVVSLAMAAVFTFAIQQFQSLMNQNEAEESLLLASFYLRATISQAVRTGSTNVDPATIFVAPVSDAAWPPDNVSAGYIRTNITCNASGASYANSPECTAYTTAWPGAAGSIETLAIFVRENGDPTATNPSSSFIPTGIFYRKPNGNSSGKIYITQTPYTGGNFVLTDNSSTTDAVATGLTFERFVAFGVSAGNASACTATSFHNALPCVNLYLRTRYFRGINEQINYDPDQSAAATAGSQFRDVDMVVNIGLRNNALNSAAASVTGQVERLYGGVYFFRFDAPTLKEF